MMSGTKSCIDELLRQKHMSEEVIKRLVGGL